MVGEPAAASKRVATTERRARVAGSSTSEKRWEHIVVKASELFAMKGFEGTSLKDIAESVGLLKGSIYYYIESKEDLLYEVTRRSLERRSAALVESEELASAAAPARLRGFVTRWMATSDVANDASQVAEREYRKLDARRLRSIMAMRRSYEDFARNILHQGVDEGSFDSDLNVSVAINTLFPLMRNARNWFSPSGTMTFAEVIDWTATLIIRGFGGDSAVSQSRVQQAR